MEFFNNPEQLLKLLRQLVNGLGVTGQLFACTLLFSLPLGLVIALLRMSRFKLVSVPIRLYILIMRGTPLILQIFTIYFFLPKLFGRIDRLPAAVIAYALNYAAYFAEIYRGGIAAIPAGQREAARVLGMNRAQTFCRVLLPQVVKQIMLPVSNEVITLLKDTALVTAVGLMEMFQAAKAATSRTGSLEPMFLAGLIYLALNSVITVVFDKVVKRMNYYKV